MCETHRYIGGYNDEITVPHRRQNRKPLPKLSGQPTSPLALPETSAITPALEAKPTSKEPVNVINAATTQLVKNAIEISAPTSSEHSEKPAELIVSQQQTEQVEENPIKTLLLAACTAETQYAGKQNRLARRDWQATTAIAIAQACGVNMGSFLVNNQQERVAAFRRVAKIVAKTHPECSNNLPQFLINPV